MRSGLFVVLLGLLSVSAVGNAPGVSDTLRLGTAVPGGGYHGLGCSIRDLLGRDGSIEIEVVATEGSTDNIRRLADREIDVAIVQNDIAFFAENGLYPFSNRHDDLSAIMSVYSEPIFIVTNDPSLIHLSQVADKKVNVGPKASGLIVDAHIILNSLNLWNRVTKYNSIAEDAIDDLLLDNVQFVFTNNITDEIQTQIDDGRLFVVGLSDVQISNLVGTYPYFASFDYTYGSEVITTVAVKSMIVCRSDVRDDVIYRLTKSVYEHFTSLDIPRTDTSSVRLLREKVIHSVPLQQWHGGASAYFEEIDVLPHDYVKYIWLALTVLLIAILFFIILEVVILSSRFRFGVPSYALSAIRTVNALTIRYKYAMVLLTMAFVYLTCMFVVQHYEHSWAIEHNIVSGFDNQSFLNNLVWMFVFGGSGYSGNLFPHSTVGKLIVTTIPLVGIGGFVAIVSIFTSDHIKRRILEAKGMSVVSAKDHILICGWNSNVPFLIKNLLHKNLANKRSIVLLADVREEMPLEKYGLERRMVSFVKGEATNREDLRRANIADADIAIIVHDEESSDPDARNILKILTIEKYGHELEVSGRRRNRANIYTIAEIQDAHVFEAAADVYVDEIISLGQIKSKIFVQAIQNPGVSKFISEILTYNEFNDLYSIPVRGGSKLSGETYDTLLGVLRRHNVLLLSINVENHRERAEVDRILLQYGLGRAVLTNPLSREENDYRTQPGDNLIVLAQYEESVDKAIRSIEEHGFSD